MNCTDIDVSHDYRKIKSDGTWDDPDATSEELKSAHKFLWTKKLPSGEKFSLYEGVAENWDNKPYLVLETSNVKYKLTSDTMINSFIGWKKFSEIDKFLSEREKQSFLREIYTIGNFILFPGNQINKNATINIERYQVYLDRFDFTLDAIRKFYFNENSELYDCLNRYKMYFDLFVDFKGFCEFFFLQDFVANDYSSVMFFLENKNSYIPSDIRDYRLYMSNATEKIKARNKRIAEYLSK